LFDARTIAVFSSFWGNEKGAAPDRLAIAARPPSKKHFQVMTTEQEIKDHTRKLEAGEQPCYRQACPHCAVKPEQPFRVHQCRRRTFRLLVERCVRVYRSWVLRLKCPHCKRTFTDYPPFRFTFQTVRQRDLARQSEGVLGDEKIVSENGSASSKSPGV